VDALTEEWLRKNDPDYLEREAEEQKETEKLFVTGPKSKDDVGNNSGTTH
jgi:hypothetical protein